MIFFLQNDEISLQMKLFRLLILFSLGLTLISCSIGTSFKLSEIRSFKGTVIPELSPDPILIEKVSIDLIQTLVCKFFKISKNEMLSSRRSRYLVRPRQTAIYLTKILTSKSLPEIGREFSNRDHTTIIHSVKTIERLKEIDPQMVENINKLKNQILYNEKQNEI